MSNRRRRTLSASHAAEIRRTLRCPDCASDVRPRRTPDGPRVDIHHDDTCPALTALQRQGRTAQIALVRRDDQTAADFADMVAAAAADTIWITGRAVRLTTTPYVDIHRGDTA